MTDVPPDAIKATLSPGYVIPARLVEIYGQELIDRLNGGPTVGVDLDDVHPECVHTAPEGTPHVHRQGDDWHSHASCVRAGEGWRCTRCSHDHDHNPPYCYRCGYTVLAPTFHFAGETAKTEEGGRG